MDRRRWNELQALFEELVELDAAERMSRLAAIGASDSELRAAVEALLAADAGADARLASMEASLLAPGSDTKRRDRLTEVLVDRYRVGRELGSGGMATVYLAEDLKHHRQVAIKVLKPKLAAVLGPERFLREIEIAARLNHPHILPLFDSGEAAGFLYYVMPYVAGESLRDRLSREQQLPLDDAVKIAREVADALDYAHRHNLVHRDVKPENILLQERHAMVADFGIARAIDVAGGTRLTETGVALGTPAYMSPEQAAGGREVDERSDLYSLGCVLYEMLAGEPPFTGPTVESIVRQQLTVEPQPITSLRPAVPAQVAEALGRALAKTPADRFATAAQLAEALEPGVREAPQVVGASVRGWRKWRIGAAALAVAAVLALGWWGVSKLRSGASAIRSLVVLPLDNLTGDPAQEYFVDGMHEALIGELSKISALKVISRTSAMHYKGVRRPPAPQIARDLGVDGLIEGSVAREADRVRITVQMIHGRSDRHLWAESYERELRGVLALQRDVAMEIARQIRVKLTPAEETHLAKRRAVHPEAYDLYLRGRHFKQQENLEAWNQALAAFERSVAIDSGFAPAWSGLAMMYALRTMTPHPDSAVVARARPAVEKALALDPTLSDAYVSLALVQQYVDWDWKEAEAPLRRALELDPSNWQAHYEYGRLLRRLARLDEAVAEMQRALALEPFLPPLYGGLITTYLSARRHDEAIEAAQRALQLLPNNPAIQGAYAAALESAGKKKEADEARKRFYALCCRMSEAEYEGLPDTRFRRYLASGERSRALAVVREMETGYPETYEAFELAIRHAQLGDNDQALRWLERSVERREGAIGQLKTLPELDILRGEPRFQALLKKVGLEQ